MREHRFKINTPAVLMPVLLGSILTACGGGNPNPTPQKPAAPTNVTATAKPGYVELSWQASGNNLKGFDIYREELLKAVNQGIKKQALSLLTSVAADVRSYQDTSVKSGTQYRYAVVSKGEGAQSDQAASGTVTAQPGTVNAAPTTQPIPDITVAAGMASQTVNLSSHFTDPENQPLTLTVVSNTQPTVVTPVITGNQLKLTFGGAGTTTLTLKATDPGGLFVTQTLKVTVTAGTTHTVTTLSDAGTGSLRDAVQKAAPGDRIQVKSGVTGTVNLGSHLYLNKSLTLDLAGLTLSGQNQHRVVFVETGATVSLSNTTLTAGRQRDQNNMGGGGLVFNKGNLTLKGVVLTHGNAETGGLVFNAENAQMTLQDSSLKNGVAEWGAGLFNAKTATLTLTGGTIQDNQASREGGGIRNHGTLTLTNTTLSGNKATERGGGFSQWSEAGTTASAMLIGVTVQGNTAQKGAGVHAINGVKGSVVQLQNSTVTGNTSTQEGGGIGVFWFGEIRLQNTTVNGNTASKGGGVFVEADATFTRTGGTVSSNTGGDVYPPFRDLLPLPGVRQEWCDAMVTHNVGVNYLENNNWNVRALPPGSTHELCLLRQNLGGQEQFGWRYLLPATGNEVYVYPEIVYGWKPWQHKGNTSPFLPARLDALPPVYADVDVTLQTTGSFNLSLSSWLTTTPALLDGPHPEVTRYEIMVWLDRDPGFLPYGEPVATTTIDGITYDLHKMPRTDLGHSWTLLTFLAKSKVHKAKLPVHEFMQFLVKGNWVEGNLYLADVELGTEGRSGTLELWLKRFEVTSP